MSCIVYPDCLFSNWVFFWYILFITKITKFNPKYYLLFAVLFNVFQLCMKVKNNASKKNISFFILFVTLFKIIPFLTITNTKSDVTDIFFGIILLISYLLYIIFNIIFKRIDKKMFEVLFKSDKERECRSFFEYLSQK